jgi:hypothetical protein
MASSSGTRLQADVSCGSTRRILTPFHFFHQLRDTTGALTHKRELELFPLTKQERRMAERAYFAYRIELLIRLKRSRTKGAKVKGVAVEQLPLFSRE